MTSQTQKMTRKRSQKMQPFFDLMDDYTGIYLCGLEDGTFSVRKDSDFHGKNMRFGDFFDFGYALTDGGGETPISFPIQFKNGMAQVHITFYHSSFFLYPYCMVLLVVCIGLFLFLVLIFCQLENETDHPLKRRCVRDGRW